MSDPTYNKVLIDSKPEWELAFTLSELHNDSAPTGWGNYIYIAEKLLRKYNITKKIPREVPARVELPETDLVPVALYCDGGVIGRNPSSQGGVWAWCGVDKNGTRIIEKGGFVPAPPGVQITNNHTEQIAICLALEAMPDGWSGLVCSDSSPEDVFGAFFV